MFRKSVFIMLFVCLLATFAIAADPWDNQLEWRSTAGDANWYNPANWSQEGDNPCPPASEGGPGSHFYCAVLPNQPGPRLGYEDAPNATCSQLQLNPWDPTSWGAQDVNLTILATAQDINCGSSINVNSWSSYDSYLGTSYLASRAIVNVYGGTVHTQNPPNQNTLNGLRIGGGNDGIGLSYGMVNIYGGEVNVPRVEINFGEIGLYGGTLIINTDPNFSLRTDHPLQSLNLLKVNGGTFKLLGDQTGSLNPLIANNHIVCERGTIGTPTFADGWTTLVSEVNYCVWNPQPLNNATNVHYKVLNDVNSITLSWSASTLYDADVNHNVYFGSVYADVCNATTATAGIFQGTRRDDANDPCSWTIKDPNNFLASTFYYWRVDEIDVDNNVNRGLVWKFKTHDNLAYNPKPVDLATALSQPLQLSWTPGDQAASHRVFFGTAWSPVNAASTSNTDGRYRGTVSSPVYPLTRLLETGANPPGASFILQNGKFYYWRIDEVNNTTTWKGLVWGFSPGAYTNIDDFEDSISTDDVNSNWPDGYAIPRDPAKCGTGDVYVHSGRILTRDSSGKFLQFVYNNGGINAAFGGNAFTEGRRTYTGGTTFTGSGVLATVPKLLQIDHRGTATNAVTPPDSETSDPNADTMYVAIEDTAGNVAIYLNEDHTAQQLGNWTSWYISLTDINSLGTPNPVDLKAVSGFSLGFGVRGTNCSPYFDGQDVNSTVMFDNIRLYGSTCVPQYGPSADMDADCDVDINDMDRLADDWLQRAQNFTFIGSTAPANPPVLWYKFDNANSSDTNSYVPDWGTRDANHYTGTINAFISTNWKTDKGRNGDTCLYLPPGGGCYVIVPSGPSDGGTPEVMGFMADAAHTAPADGNTAPGGGGISFAVWINTDTTSSNMQTSWNGLFGTWNGAVSTETLEVHCPAPLNPLTDPSGPRTNFIKRSPSATVSAFDRNYADYGGRWNHWAFVKEPSHMSLYLNGNLLNTIDANQQPGDPNVNVYGPLFDPNVGAVRIGTRGGNWGMWNGYMQDFQVYDYALTAGEVAYLATDGAGEVFLPLVSPANINKDGSTSPLTDVNQIVDFRDMAIMCNQWHTLQLWP